jgi:CO/xanthine dehydrogenase Mo-binding subunit
MSGQPYAIPASQAQPRGFVIARSPGEPQRPGSLHVQPRLSKWLSLAERGCVRVFTGKVEIGQGILTALQLIAAEELDLPLAAVHVQSARTDQGPDEGVTSGSLSVQDSGGALRHACAHLRGLALQRASQAAALAPEAIDVRDGRFVSPQGEVLGDYWSLLDDADLEVDYDPRWLPKPPPDRRLLGRASPARLDLSDKVFGRPRFIQDLRLPGMLHGRVLRAPTLDARLQAWPPAGMGEWPPGAKAWADGSFVAVVAPSERQADALADRLREALAWAPGESLPDAHALPGFLRSAPSTETQVAARGDAQWPEGGRRIRSQFFKPYLAHASIGPSCALAQWDGSRLLVWTHSQGIHNLRDDIVLALV